MRSQVKEIVDKPSQTEVDDYFIASLLKIQINSSAQHILILFIKN